LYILEAKVSALKRFSAIDSNGDGKLTFKEAESYLSKHGIKLSSSDKDW
jgi:hypothetical protein